MDNSKQDQTDTAVSDIAALRAAREDAAIWQTRAAHLQAQAQRAGEDKEALAQQVATLQAQLTALETYAAGLQARLAQSESLRDAERAATRAVPLLARAVPRPAIVDLVTQLARSADPASQYQLRPQAQIRRLIIHHSGAANLSPSDMASLHVSDPKHQWPGIGFHFFIAADGAIYQTNRLETISYHAAEHNATSVGIVLAGQFDVAGPPAAQMAGTAALLAWLLQELRLPADSIAGHSEFPDQQSNCPGATWAGSNGWKPALLDMVSQQSRAVARPIYHYVLFWQKETAWAEADWQAATAYIARFQPTAGFSVQEAGQASHVTIIGGQSGISQESEDKLRAAGCRVQRIAGKNAKETRRLLDTLARDGRRFLATEGAQ